MNFVQCFLHQMQNLIQLDDFDEFWFSFLATLSPLLQASLPGMIAQTQKISVLVSLF